MSLTVFESPSSAPSRPETTTERNRRLCREAFCNLDSVYPAGERVGTAPHTDAWMQGDRWGNVERIGPRNLRIYVRLDSGRLGSFLPADLRRERDA